MVLLMDLFDKAERTSQRGRNKENNRREELTVEVFLVVLECERPVVLPQSHDGRDVLGVLVGEALHQNLLVGPPGADLHPLQVEQLLEDAPLDLVPGGRMEVSVTE